jgi:hypothetical protein
MERFEATPFYRSCAAWFCGDGPPGDRCVVRANLRCAEPVLNRGASALARLVGGEVVPDETVIRAAVF